MRLRPTYIENLTYNVVYLEVLCSWHRNFGIVLVKRNYWIARFRFRGDPSSEHCDVVVVLLRLEGLVSKIGYIVKESEITNIPDFPLLVRNLL